MKKLKSESFLLYSLIGYIYLDISFLNEFLFKLLLNSPFKIL